MPAVVPDSAVPFTTAYTTSYDPDVQAYLDLQTHQKTQRLGQSASLPDAFPVSVTGPEAWTPATLQSSFVFHFTKLHCVEINSACKSFSASGQDLSLIDQKTFPLPLLSSELQNRRRELHYGCGVVLFRGLNVAQYSRRENVIIFAGLSAHMSERRGIQAAGKILGEQARCAQPRRGIASSSDAKLQVHIRDLSAIAPGSLSVAPYTNIKLPFHTDYGDVLSILVLGVSSHGGNGLLSPVASIYNELAGSRPDLISVLSTPNWPFDRPINGGICEQRPVLYWLNGKPEMIFSRGALLRSEASQRLCTMPLLSSSQAEALDAVHFTAKKYSLNIVWEKGDVLFFNNRKILHGRDAFQDTEDDSEARHFLRLWLQDEELAGPPPECLQTRWDHIFCRRVGGSEGHETAAETNEHRWPLEPISRAEDALSKRI